MAKKGRVGLKGRSSAIAAAVNAAAALDDSSDDLEAEEPRLTLAEPKKQPKTAEPVEAKVVGTLKTKPSAAEDSAPAKTQDSAPAKTQSTAPAKTLAAAVKKSTATPTAAAKKERLVGMTVRLDTKTHDQLREIAFRKRISIHSLLLEGVQAAIKRHG